ncbi:MAG: chemotaxis protein CheW [Actinomycetia bacterium]|nr:chemotaxis protein CheW [Actinomycetes bacterium]
MSELLIVHVGPYVFGAPVAMVSEILARPAVTRVPRTPPVVAGVAVVRGQPLAVLTCRPLLGLPVESVPVALRWGEGRGVALVAADQVEQLWTPGDPLPPETWQDVVPAEARPWIAAGYRQADRWIWAWPADLPERLGSRDVEEVARSHV